MDQCNDKTWNWSRRFWAFFRKFVGVKNLELVKKMPSNSILPSYLLPPLPVRLVNRKVKQITQKMWSKIMLRCNGHQLLWAKCHPEELEEGSIFFINKSSEKSKNIFRWKNSDANFSHKNLGGIRQNVWFKNSPTKIWEAFANLWLGKSRKYFILQKIKRSQSDNAKDQKITER